MLKIVASDPISLECGLTRWSLYDEFLGRNRPHMDVRYINPFIEAVKHVFSTMLMTDIFISKPFIKTGDEQRSDVSAIIGISGDAVGSVALCFPMKSGVNVASKFAGIEMTKDHEDFADALGELANMVAGQAKSKLDGLSCSISLPNVIIGEQLMFSNSKAAPRLVLPCDSALGRFCVEVGMVTKKQSADSKAGKGLANAVSNTAKNVH